MLLTGYKEGLNNKYKRESGRARVAQENVLQHLKPEVFTHDRRAPATLWHSSSINSSAKGYGIMKNRNMGFFVLHNGVRVSKTNVSKTEIPTQTTDNCMLSDK